MQVIRTRNVIFNKTQFYDSAKINSIQLLITIMKDIVKILKISNNIFFEVVIQKKNDHDEYIDHIENESIKEIDQFNKSKNLQIDLKKFLLLTSEMISERDQMIFNANIIDMIDLSIEQEILKTFFERNDVQKTMNERNNVQKTLCIENDSQFLIKFKRKKNSTIMSIDVVAMNIKSRKSVYAIA
jgi:hypothetical protein